MGIGDDTTRHRSGNLTHQHLLAVRGADDDGAALVLGARFGKICGQETARMMLDKGDLAVDGEPVGMHVENAHEHRQLEAAALQHLGLVNLLEGDYLAVGRRHNGAVGIAGIDAAGRAEKVNDEHIQHAKDRGAHDGPDERPHPQPQGHVDGKYHQQQYHQNVCAFVMNLYSH